MFHSDKQRRWWFANHPEYSADPKGKRSQPGERPSKKPPKVPPEEVDSYARKWGDYATELGSTVLKSFEKTFGTASLKTGDPSELQDEEARWQEFLKQMKAQGRTDIERLKRAWKLSESTRAHARIGAWAWQNKGILSSLKKLRGGTGRIPESIVKQAAARRLGNNMKAVGKNPPSLKDHSAHHIVAIRDRRAVKAREILDKYDIKIDQAENGVWLPKKRGVGPGAYHPGLGTDKYYENVSQMLGKAKSKEDALKILEKIADQLSNNTFPYK